MKVLSLVAVVILFSCEFRGTLTGLLSCQPCCVISCCKPDAVENDPSCDKSAQNCPPKGCSDYCCFYLLPDMQSLTGFAFGKEMVCKWSTGDLVAYVSDCFRPPESHSVSHPLV